MGANAPWHALAIRNASALYPKYNLYEIFERIIFALVSFLRHWWCFAAIVDKPDAANLFAFA
jgi:hypothetical protein